MQLVIQVLIGEQLMVGVQRHENQKAHADLVSAGFSTTGLFLQID
jgi:hypothetical protein